jgi:hypothetical protein
VTSVEETSYFTLISLLVVAAALVAAYLKVSGKQGDFEKVKSTFTGSSKKTFEEDLLNSKDTFERVI